MQSSFSAVTVVAVACLLGSCKSAPAPLTHTARIALLPFDNLSGDESLQWIQDAVPAIMASQLTGEADNVAFRAATMRDATSADAARVVHGYFDKRKSALHFEISIEDLATHKMIQTMSLDSNLLDVAGQIAKAIDSKARLFSTANSEALAAWGKHDYATAVMLDPDFGAAWLEWIETLAGTGHVDEATARSKEALSRPSLHDAIEKTKIALQNSRLTHDVAAQDKATLDLIALLPHDDVLPKSLAELAGNERRFDQSVRLYQEAARRAPADPNIPNLLGYELFFAGNLPEARKQFQLYGRIAGQEANAADSDGEVLFMAGQFADAERSFLSAHDKNPAMLNGGDLLKAAYAHWLGGDLPGAEKIFGRYLAFRKEHGDQALGWRQAIWEYSTGRKDQAIAGLSKTNDQLSQQQLALWKNLDKINLDAAALEKSYRATQPTTDGMVRTLYAAALMRAGKREEASKLLVWWPLPESGEPLFQSIVFPMFQQLRQQLQATN